MSKRGNYPYLSADMFPQNPNITTSLRITSTTSRTGSVISNQSSSIYIPRPTINYGYSSSSTLVSRLKNIKVMVKRLFKPKTLDFETAIWEIFHLIVNPKKMYRSHYYYKQQQHEQLGNGNSYTRDDPSFDFVDRVLSLSAIAWGWHTNLVLRKL